MTQELDASTPFRAHGARAGILDVRGHACGFFQDREEEYEVLMPFIREGLALGERAVHSLEPGNLDDHLQRLASAGIEVDHALQTGQLVVMDWNAHFWAAPFDRERLFAANAAFIEKGRDLGFRKTRFVTEMGWALEGPSVRELALYEAMSDLLPLDSDTIICAYRTSQWGGQMVMNALRTHQYVILGGLVHQNPFHHSQAVIDAEGPRPGHHACC